MLAMRAELFTSGVKDQNLSRNGKSNGTREKSE
jgi:hypothetical protein